MFDKKAMINDISFYYNSFINVNLKKSVEPVLLLLITAAANFFLGTLLIFFLKISILLILINLIDILKYLFYMLLYI